ncbi:MAG: ribonuclease HI family protein [bacterium]|nr:ribonuclease HI family protein [bacterium]
MKNKVIFKEKIIVYTDGGARGNPGPAAIGAVIAAPSGRASPELLGRGDKEYGEYIGEKTNNQAEYEAVIFALKKIKQLIGKKNTKETEIEIRMDSELVVRQLLGKYKILEPDLQPLFLEIWNLRLDFKKIDFTHIPREKNRKADRLVNKALNSIL